MNRFVQKGESLLKGVFSGLLCVVLHRTRQLEYIFFLKKFLIYFGWAGSFSLCESFRVSGGYFFIVVCGFLIVVASLQCRRRTLKGTIGRIDLALQVLYSSFFFLYMC